MSKHTFKTCTSLSCPERKGGKCNAHKKIKKIKLYSATWTVCANPLYYVECPHCKAPIFMSKIGLIEKLKAWANYTKELFTNK